MGLKTFTVDFVNLKSNESIRLWVPFVLPKSKYRYEKINNFLSVCESGSRPKGGINDEDDGEAISLGGEQIGVDGSLDLSKIPYVSFDFYDSVAKGKVQDNDILICKDGALTGKSCWVDFSLFPSDKVMVNEHVYILRGSSEINQKFLFYYTTTNLFQSQVKDLAYRKKAQPGLNLDHFKKIKIPLVSKEEQDKIVAKIEPIENKIKKLKAQITPPQEIINQVFAREFKFDLAKFEELKNVKHLEVDFLNINNHKDLRFSVSDFKNYLLFIKSSTLIPQDEFPEISIKRILEDSSCQILKKRELDFEYLLIELENVGNNNGLVLDIQEVSEIGSDKLLFADADILTTKLRPYLGKSILNEFEKEAIGTTEWIPLKINQNLVLKEYLLYILLSSFYVEKSTLLMSGKNHPRIKPEILFDFQIPYIPLNFQQKIVDEIKSELEKQEEIKRKIESKRDEIDKIIKTSLKIN
ncbi:MAG: hypothetical protein GX282_02400 [Campylobacteraceae bacterium]|nr:hypothetical protein [Campylobacteraceae bacterium]